MTKLLSFVLTFALLAMSVTNIFADQITLKNGDRVTGKVIKQDEDKIVLQTEFAGEITISKTNVEKVLLDSSYTKEAEKVGTTETEKNVEKTAAVTASTVAPATAAKNPGLGFTAGWDGTANLGFSFTSGNSKTSTFTAGIRAEKSSEKDKWTTYANSLWNRNRITGITVTTSNAIWGGLRYDRNITKKVFGFGSYDFERDKPQRLNFRSVVGAGLGYHAVKNDNTELDFFGGAAWNKTWFVGNVTKSSAEVLVGNTLKHKFNDKVKVQQGFTFYPNLTDTGEYRFVFDTTFSADLTKRMGWFVTIADRYNSLPLLGVEKNDFLFATGLKFGFGKTK
ncbi:MAG: DUF481 domain-containing protein [Pyrinomonadaceae bacterium]|nr:DUF481 domain-containing protein [Pyrinomonadaceae bacterium]